MFNQSRKLLNSIWSGDTIVARENNAPQIQGLIGEIFPMDSILLRVPDGPLCGRVFRDDAEVLPSLPIGDVIAEEFAVDVPHGTLIICCSDGLLSGDCGADHCSSWLAHICAEIILDTVLLGNYRIEAENEVFSILASDALSSALTSQVTSIGFDASLFGKALARKLDGCIRKYAIGYEQTFCDEDAWTSCVEQTLLALALKPETPLINDGKKASSNSLL